jgi:hypothetical protein
VVALARRGEVVLPEQLDEVGRQDKVPAPGEAMPLALPDEVVVVVVPYQDGPVAQLQQGESLPPPQDEVMPLSLPDEVVPPVQSKVLVREEEHMPELQKVKARP